MSVGRGDFRTTVVGDIRAIEQAGRRFLIASQTTINSLRLAITTNPDALSDAYNVRLKFEKSIPPDGAALVYTRTLGWLDHPLPLPHSARQGHTFMRTGPCEAAPTRADFYLLFQPSLSRNEPKRDLSQAPKTYEEAKDLVKGDVYAMLVPLSPQALVRDGIQCVVSGIHDQTTPSEVSAPSVRISRQSPLNEDLSNEELVLAVLKSFGYVIEQLNGTNIHSLSNIITMQSYVHEWFTRLEFRFTITLTPPYPTQSHLHPGPLRNAIHFSLPPEKHPPPQTTRTFPFHPRPARCLCKGRPVFWGG
ncbi:hypothetical protein EV421DRAFT_1908521 [Armillaria borealis]|uniref:HNH nuclease domain-containing protein n=1 Tax=Armillaria borealis TaxID=47425 RepID=A0AA39MJ18_9AGAR|nr:hypothetical protein EV421DRAFT_1908521 [Armillaria borealis]